MELPKKITPDNIKNAIVEFSVSYNTAYEVVLGLVLNKVMKDKSYNYARTHNVPSEMQQLVSRNYLFYNDKIKFQFSPQAININCLNSYISWREYLPQIKKILSLIVSIGEGIKINRLGLRYVSEYENKDLKESLKFNFTFGFPEISSNHYSFNTEFEYKKAIVILTIRNQMPSRISNEIKNLSHIDIDVIKKDLDINFSDKNLIIQNLEQSHSYEKEIFFGIVKNDFLKTLKPEY